MPASRAIDAATLLDSVSPAAAVHALTQALVDGYDPAGDLPRTAAHTSAGQILTMPSEVGEFAGIKIVTLAPGNPEQGLPLIEASYLLFDAPTLRMQATIDGTALTTLRTPAVSIAAIQPLLQRFAQPLSVVVFGTGPQGIGHIHTLQDVLSEPLGSVSFVARNPDEVSTEARDLGEVLQLDSDEALAALGHADVVICATSAREPLFSAAEISDRAVVVAMGSHEPDARELPGELLGSATVIVEDLGAALREAGDVIMAIDEGHVAEADLVTMSQVLTGSVTIPDDRRAVFKGVGMPWEDLVVARAAYERTVNTSFDG